MANVFRLAHRNDNHDYYVLHSHVPKPGGGDANKHHHMKPHGRCKIKIVALGSAPVSPDDYYVTTVENPPQGVVAVVKHSRKSIGNGLVADQDQFCEITQETDTASGSSTSVPKNFCSCGDDTQDCPDGAIPVCPPFHCVLPAANISPVELAEQKRPAGRKR